jgi:hypothetical protein
LLFFPFKIVKMPPARIDEDGFDVAINDVPVTEWRRPFIQQDGDERLTHTGETTTSREGGPLS